MALVNCPECSAEVSDTAFKCSKCGFQLRKPKRTLVGKIIKWGFIVFNIVMLIWLVGGVGSAAQETQALNGAEQVGAAIGTGIGAMLIGGIWVVGDIILGIMVLFTRPKST